LPIQRVLQQLDRDLTVSDILTMHHIIGKPTLDAGFEVILPLVLPVGSRRSDANPGWYGSRSTSTIVTRAQSPTLWVTVQPRVYNHVMSPNMEPTLITDPALMGVLEELKSREPIFHRPELGTTRADFEDMTAADFWEVGASGRRYSRGYVLDELERRYAAEYVDIWEVSELHCRRLSEDVYLLTYMLLQNKERMTRRATIWQNTPTGWKIVFHQGTIVQDS
jgi:hypothetical protein